MSDFERVELAGGRAVLYSGDCLKIMPSLDPVDAVIADPPYASGGMYRGDRVAPPARKYMSSEQEHKWQTFAHDAKDQRVWMSWCTEWLQALPVRDGSYVLSFVDWRQLPALTDAFQWAGLIWRGLIAWDKGNGSRPPTRATSATNASTSCGAPRAVAPPPCMPAPTPAPTRPRYCSVTSTT